MGDNDKLPRPDIDELVRPDETRGRTVPPKIVPAARAIPEQYGRTVPPRIIPAQPPKDEKE